MHFSGGESWIFDLFKELFKGSVKTSVEKAAAGGVKDLVNGNLNQALRKIPPSFTAFHGTSKVVVDARFADLLVAAVPNVTADGGFGGFDASGGVLCAGDAFTVMGGELHSACPAAFVTPRVRLPLLVPSAARSNASSFSFLQMVHLLPARCCPVRNMTNSPPLSCCCCL